MGGADCWPFCHPHRIYSLHRDPFAIHRQHMNRMLSGGFGYSPFLSITDGSMPGTRPASRRMQVMVLQQT